MDRWWDFVHVSYLPISFSRLLKIFYVSLLYVFNFSNVQHRLFYDLSTMFAVVKRMNVITENDSSTSGAHARKNESSFGCRVTPYEFCDSVNLGAAAPWVLFILVYFGGGPNHLSNLTSMGVLEFQDNLVHYFSSTESNQLFALCKYAELLKEHVWWPTFFSEKYLKIRFIIYKYLKNHQISV